MSLYDYRESQEITKKDYGFYSLIMAAMRQADSINIICLRSTWPEIWNELQERYNTPGGKIKGEN